MDSSLTLVIYIFVVLILMLWLREVISNRKESSYLALARPWFEAGRLRHPLASRLNTCSQTDWAVEGQAEKLKWISRPYDQPAFSPLDSTDDMAWPLAICLLVLILMQWQQGSGMKSKGNQLSSFAEFRIRTQGLWNRYPSRLNAHRQTDWAIEDQAKYLNSIAHPYVQRAFSPLDPTDMASHTYIQTHICIHTNAHIHAYIHTTYLYAYYIYTCVICMCQTSNWYIVRNYHPIHNITKTSNLKPTA